MKIQAQMEDHESHDPDRWCAICPDDEIGEYHHENVEYSANGTNASVSWGFAILSIERSTRAKEGELDENRQFGDVE